eukprot:9389955-Pyramimonas_sp.AAC.2
MLNINGFGFLRPSWEAFWGALDASWKLRGRCCGNVGRIGALLGRLGGLLGPLGRFLGPAWHALPSGLLGHPREGAHGPPRAPERAHERARAPEQFEKLGPHPLDY